MSLTGLEAARVIRTGETEFNFSDILEHLPKTDPKTRSRAASPSRSTAIALARSRVQSRTAP